MEKKKLINWLCLSGVLSVIFYLLHDVVGAMNYPGYNWMSQAVSDLTAIVVLMSIISLILIAVGSLKGENKHKLLGILAIISLILMFIGAAGNANVSKEIFGVIERFSTYSAVIFTGILGIYGFKVFKE